MLESGSYNVESIELKDGITMSSRNSIFVSKLLIEDLSSTDHLDAGVSTGRLFF
jgi:hypothetical protein